MANTQQLQKRTSTPGKRPGISDIALGEIAINTYDGKMFIKRDANGNIDVVQVGDDQVENVFYVAKGAIKGNLGTSLQDAFSTLDSAITHVTTLHAFTFDRVKCKRDFGFLRRCFRVHEMLMIHSLYFQSHHHLREGFLFQTK